MKIITISLYGCLDIYPLLYYNIDMLKYSFHNSKLNKLAVYRGLKKNQVVSFDLPAGYACPKAFLCKAFANPHTGKIVDGRNMKFRCYAASGENVFKNTRAMRWHNFNILRHLSYYEIVQEIINSLPKTSKAVRIHSSGDYFKRDYFMAWVSVAKLCPNIIFFGYTKFLEYHRYARKINLPNFKIAYSFGGLDDGMIDTDDAVVYVIDTPESASDSLPTACVKNPADDYDFIMKGVLFCIPLHGTQPTRQRKKR